MSQDPTELDPTDEAVENLSDAQLEDLVEHLNDETLRILKERMDDPDPEVSQRAKLLVDVYGSFVGFMNELEDEIAAKRFDQVEVQSKAFLERTKLRLEQETQDSELVQRALQELQDFMELYAQMVETAHVEEPNTRMRLLSTGLDIIPIVGGVKMLAESVRGRTLAGDEVKGMARATHAGEGVLWLTVDGLVLLAEVPTLGQSSWAELLKAPKAAKLLHSTAGTLRAAGMTENAAKALSRAGKFLEENVKAGEAADKLVGRGARNRRAAKEALPGAFEDAKEAYKNKREILAQVEKERRELLAALGDIIQPDVKLAA